MFNPIKKSIAYGGHTLTLETGEIARQANGAVLVSLGDTVVLVTAVIIGVPTLLILLQPDFGTAMLVGISGAFVLFLAGLSWWWFVAAAGAVNAGGTSPSFKATGGGVEHAFEVVGRPETIRLAWDTIRAGGEVIRELSVEAAAAFTCVHACTTSSSVRACRNVCCGNCWRT